MKQNNKMKLNDTQKQKLLEEMKHNFWEQKVEEVSFGLVLIMISIALIFIVFVSGQTVHMQKPEFYCSGFFGSSDSFTANCADPNYHLSFWSYLSLGMFFWLIVFIIGLLILALFYSIKLGIDSNIKKAFNRSIDNLNKEKGGKK